MSSADLPTSWGHLRIPNVCIWLSLLNTFLLFNVPYVGSTLGNEYDTRHQ